jgi:hypothetical protein
MKRGARIVNVARGGVIEEEALVRALEAGIVAGAALDVFATEPPAADNPLVAHPAVICTPHLGASTKEAQEEVAYEIAEAVISALKGELTPSCVNAPMVAPEVLKELQPFVTLADSLGRAAVQLVEDSGFSDVYVTYHSPRGDDLDTRLLRAMVVKGMLEQITTSQVNLVNADLLAKKRGLRIVETVVPSEGTQALTEIEVGCLKGGCAGRDCNERALRRGPRRKGFLKDAAGAHKPVLPAGACTHALLFVLAASAPGQRESTSWRGLALACMAAAATSWRSNLHLLPRWLAPPPSGQPCRKRWSVARASLPPLCRALSRHAPRTPPPPPLLRLLRQVAIGASKSKFSSAVTGDRITVAGQVKNKAPFLTRVGAFDVDLALEGEVVLVRQTDQPGIIAAVSSEFAAASINISFMTVSRVAKGTEAIMAIGVDSAPTAEVGGLGL